MFKKDIQYYRFCAYGFLKNLRFFEPFLIIILHHEGLSFTQIGVLYAIREIFRNILEIPAGVFADAFGRRKSMLLAFSSYIISFVVFFMAGSFVLFILAFLLYSVGDAFRTGTHKAMIFTHLELNSWEKQKVSYYGHTRSWSQTGSAISALAAGLFILFTGEYKIIFLLSCLPYLLDLINLATYPKSLDGIGREPGKRKYLNELITTFRNFTKAFKSYELRDTVLSISTYTGYYKAVKDFIQPMIQALAISLPFLSVQSLEKRTAILVGIIYFILFLLSSLAARKSGRILKLFPNSRQALNITFAIGLALGLASGFFVHLNLLLPALVLFSGIYLVQNVRKPIGIGKVADHIDSKILASALSAESQAETIFAAIFVLILGIFTDLLGLGIGILILSLLVFLINLLLRTISRKERQFSNSLIP